MITNRMSRRTFLVLSGVTGGAALLAACAPAAGPAASSGGEAAAPAADRIEITFSGWGGTEEDEGVRAAITQFESEQETVKVTWLHTPDANEQNTKLLADLAAGTPPDTSFIQGASYRTYIRDNMLLDITDKLKADSLVGAENYFIEPQESERCTQDGKWYGIGSCWVAPHIYLNADVFAEAGIEPPTNDPDEAWEWDYFVEVAKQLTVDTAGKHPGDDGFDPDNIDRFGIHWPTWWIPVHSAIEANGGHYIDPESGLLVLDTPEATQAIQRIADLMLVHHVMPQGTAMEALGMTNTQMLENGKLAMAVDGSWALAWMHKITPTLGTAALPKMKTTATNMQAHLHSVLAASQHPEEAWQWVRFLSTPFYQTQFCKIGLWLPSQTNLMTEEGLQTWITEGVHPPDYQKIATEFLPNYGRVLYQPVGWPQADQIITPALDKVWVGDATAEQAMAEAVPEANAVLQEEAAN